MEEDVIGFEISMHDVVLVEDLEGFKELFEDEECFPLFEGVLFSEEAFKGAPIAILVDKVEVILCFEHIVVGDDMFVLFDVGEDIDFMDGTFL